MTIRRWEIIIYAIAALGFGYACTKRPPYPKDEYSWGTGLTWADSNAVRKYGSWVVEPYLQEDRVCLWARRMIPMKAIWDKKYLTLQ